MNLYYKFFFNEVFFFQQQCVGEDWFAYISEHGAKEHKKCHVFDCFDNCILDFSTHQKLTHREAWCRLAQQRAVYMCATTSHGCQVPSSLRLFRGMQYHRFQCIPHYCFFHVALNSHRHVHSHYQLCTYLCFCSHHGVTLK